MLFESSSITINIFLEFVLFLTLIFVLIYLNKLIVRYKIFTFIHFNECYFVTFIFDSFEI